MPQRLIFLSFLLFCVISLPAQQSRLLHENYPLDSIQDIELALKGDIEIETWPGNTILIETFLEVYDASRAVFDYYINSGRYELEAAQEGKRLRLSHKEEMNKQIRNKTSEFYEQLNIRILVPEEFVSVGPDRLRRKETGVMTTQTEEANKP